MYEEWWIHSANEFVDFVSIMWIKVVGNKPNLLGSENRNRTCSIKGNHLYMKFLMKWLLLCHSLWINPASWIALNSIHEKWSYCESRRRWHIPKFCAKSLMFAKSKSLIFRGKPVQIMWTCIEKELSRIQRISYYC